MNRQQIIIAAASPNTYYPQHHHLNTAPLFPPQVPGQHHYHDPSLGPLVYRPLHSPIETHYQHQLAAEQQLSLASAAGFHQYPSTRHHIHQPQPPTPRHLRQTRLQARQRQQHVMAHQQSQKMTEEQLAELQKESNQWQPEATGPLVGQRQPSTALTSEYATADPVYQTKTTSLPQKYSHYRTIRGDGKCGWRAVAFGYFEALIRLGDAGKFLEEEGRLRSLSNIVSQSGQDLYTFDDFADVTFDLIRELSSSDILHNGKAEDVLLEKFNGEGMEGEYIITYLRMLTAAWMKTHESEYAAWLLQQTVEQYTQAVIMPVNTEIEHVGLSALKDVLLSPAGIALEVLYLDRSPGSEVTMHRFDPVNINGATYAIGTARLLYRPGHYDILYKPEDLPPLPPTATYLQYASQPHHEVYDLGVSDFMTMIPGMSFANPTQGWMSAGYGSATDFFGSSSVQACSPTAANPAPTAPSQQIASQSVYVPSSPTGGLVSPPVQIPQELAIRTAPHSSTLPQAHTSLQHPIGPFRPSAWELEPQFVEVTSQIPFQTSIFKNSHYNQAHYQNPDFQPEQWDPEDEYGFTPTRPSRQKSG